MSRKTCLRCDWEGDTKEAACPNCGVSLYVVDPAPSPMAREPARADHVEQNDDAPSPPRGSPSGAGSPSWSDPTPAATDVPGSSSRSTRSAGAVVVAVHVLVFTFGTWLASREQGAVRASSTEAAGQAAAPGDGSPTPVTSQSPPPLGVGPVDSLPDPRSWLWVGDVRLSFRVRTVAGSGSATSRSTSPPLDRQDAEAMIFWTAFPDGEIVEPCADLLRPRDGLMPPIKHTRPPMRRGSILAWCLTCTSRRWRSSTR
jgi:hypothetical protein